MSSHSFRGRPSVVAGAFAVAAVLTASHAGAQSCAVTRAIVAPAAMEGRPIRSVTIDAGGPTSGAKGSRLLRRLHRDTRPARVRQELLFAAGDVVDTLRVAESMRRLRALGFLDDVALEARQCAGAAGVDLTVVTRDGWSATPVVKVRSTAATLGVDERNALGTGVAVHVALQSNANGLGAVASARLPGLPFRALTSEVGAVTFTNGGSWYAGLDTRALVAGPAWTFSARLSATEVEPRTQPGSLLDRSSATVLVGRRIAGAALGDAAVYSLGGVERQRADLAARDGDAVLGPRRVRRDFAGADAGLARVATRFDTLTWLLPAGGVADVPHGVESEVVAGLGRDRVTGALATHWDGWAGRVFDRPDRATLVAADAWASGYAGDDLLRSSTVRAALAVRRRAPGGGWAMTAAAERLTNPDPDVRALASLDPLAGALPRTTRLAEAALSSSLERTLRIRRLTRSVALDGALFAAGSYRWDPVGGSGVGGASADALGLAAVGVGLRLAPTRSPRATVRVDVGVPVAHTGAVRGRPFVAIGITPWLLDGRQRDGRRSP